MMANIFEKENVRKILGALAPASNWQKSEELLTWDLQKLWRVDCLYLTGLAIKTYLCIVHILMQGYMLDWPPLSIYIIATAAGEQYYQYVAKWRCVRLKYLASTPFAPSIKVLKCLSGGPCLTISAHITVCLFHRTILQTGNVQIASRINMLITLGYCRLCLEFSAFSIRVEVYLKIIQTKELIWIGPTFLT